MTRKQKNVVTKETLLAKARSEVRSLEPAEFLPAVKVLREKGFSWRECAAWLDQHAGIQISHTQLLRMSRSHLQD